MNALIRHPRIKSLSLLLFGLLVLVCTALALHDSQAVSAGLSPVETRVLGQNRWLCAGPAALRVTVSDHRTGNPLPARVTISLTPSVNGAAKGKARKLYAGATGALGTVDAHFTAPANAPGTYQLTVAVKTALGDDEVVQQVQLVESVQVLLTADKPLYQPGQTMHLRALALDPATRDAIRDETLIFEVEDARGNKVFKQAEKLGEFGVASVDFTLADEVNMGIFTLRAILPEGNTEKKVRVERYVLPKYRASIKTEKPYYLPGEMVKGTVQADYFFGKPVVGEVFIEVNTLNIGVDKLAELRGKTDAQGTYKFEYELPKSFVGQPFEQGKAVLEFHGLIIDTAEHRQEVNAAVPVVKDPMLLVIVPENRTLAPGVKNRVYIAAATPDGTPLANLSLTVLNGNTAAGTLTTDMMGLATYEFTPAGKVGVQLTVNAKTADGRTASTSQTLESSPSAEGIILRTNKSLAKVGDKVYVAAISTTKRGTIYLDVIRNKQTILTKAMEAENGQALLNLPITHDMVGTLELHAYKILPNEDIIRDTQVMVVTPADDLNINVAADKAQYRPGEDAVLKFTVKDQQQHPVFAALGLAIVDESVFALSELQPGLEKIYFMLEKELMEPKYEIHGLKPVDLILDPIHPIDPVRPIDPVVLENGRQLAACVLFAAVPAQGNFDIHVNTYQQRWEKMKVQVIESMSKSGQKIHDAVNRYRQETKTSLTADQTLFLLVDKGYLKLTDLQDRWGNFFKSDLHGAKNYDGWFAIGSAGPDGRWGTVDDVTEVVPHQLRWMRDGIIFKAGGNGGGPMVLDAPMVMPMNAGIGWTVVSSNTGDAKGDTGNGGADAPVRIREYFPETMYWNPSIITDEKGKAEIRIPMADSITTWRMSTIANTIHGQLGSTTTPLRVFQDFFVDIDLPIALTQNDRVEIPVAVYNYLPEPQQVTLTMEPGAWFAISGPNEQVVQMGKDEVKVVYFPITVSRIGHFDLTVQAKGTRLADAIRRTIDVLPDGKEIRTTINDRLDGKVVKTVTIPDNAIDDASNVWVKLYPGTFSQVVEGLDGILRMPNGCFEQTSSTTYPNILVLDYLKKTKHINPELQMKAEQYINVGYQRLVTFECKSGGFSWFGNEPAHQILTAYGLLEFTDMDKVHEVDPAVISRTQQWLAGRQKADGSWEETSQGIAEGIIDRQTGALRSTAYIAWALAESGFQGPQVGKALQYVKAHLNEAKDPYSLAVILNLFTITEPNGATAGTVAQALIDSAKTTDKAAYWESDTKTFTGATQAGADLETTGLAAYGLVKWGRNAGFTTKVLTHLVQSKDSFGTWSSTQGTVWSMKALLFASDHAAGSGNGKVIVTANGKQAATFDITAQNSDVMRQIDLGTFVHEGENTITLQYEGDGSLLYQIVGRYYLPWALIDKQPAEKAPMSIDVDYDKTTLAQDDTASVTVKIANNLRAMVEMPLIDVGVPPGFTVVTEKLDEAVQAKTISKYTVAARQIIIYLEKLDVGQSVTLHYQLKAKYPIKARTPQSKAYPYYNPEQAAVSAPQNMTVKK
ncbi:MAG: alpha-2-macroglobulin family protein [Armatimonadota bacterium]